MADGPDTDRTAESDLEVLARALAALGCPPEKSGDMAAQLNRRAGQLAERTGRTHDEALAHLLRLMAGGWAASANANVTGTGTVAAAAAP